MRLELHVNTAGAAFGAPDDEGLTEQLELGRILCDIGHDIKLHGLELNQVRRIHNADGNSCGYWIFTDEELPLTEQVRAYQRMNR